MENFATTNLWLGIAILVILAALVFSKVRYAHSERKKIEDKRRKEKLQQSYIPTLLAFILRDDKKVLIRCRPSDIPTKMMFDARLVADLNNRVWIKNREPECVQGSEIPEERMAEFHDFPKGDLQELWDTYAGKRFVIHDNEDGTYDREFVDRDLREVLLKK